MSCQDASNEKYFRTPDFKNPILTGLVFKGDNPHQIIGILGKPNNNPEQNNYRLNAYPSPFLQYSQMEIQAPNVTNVLVYILPANLGQPASSLVNNYSAGATTLVAGGLPLAEFEFKIDGRQTLSWQPADTDTKPGFYRVYALFEDGPMLWEDIWYMTEKEMELFKHFN